MFKEPKWNHYKELGAQTVQEQRNTRTGVAVSALAVLAAALPPYVVAQEQGIDVTLLGTGDPVPRVDRFGPAILVEAGECQLLFDAGRSVVLSGDTRFDENLIEAAQGADPVRVPYPVGVYCEAICGVAGSRVQSSVILPMGIRSLPASPA